MSLEVANISHRVDSNTQLIDDVQHANKASENQKLGDSNAASINDPTESLKISLPATDPTSSSGKESMDTSLPSKQPTSTQAEHQLADGNAEQTPPVPPRSKKRRVAELKCFEVRWFHRKYQTETKWTAFKGADSLLLEVRWRQRTQTELDQITAAHLRAVKLSTSVVVLNGLYRASEDLKTLHSIYWKDDILEIRRGIWFLAENLQPIDPAMADPIEKHHLQIFRSQTIPDTPVFSEKESSKKPVLAELKLQDLYEVRWNSVIDITLYNNSKTSRLLRYITWGKGTSLKRGYEEADWDDGKQIIKHLVLVVHGIGQKGYENLIAKNTDHVRESIYNYMDKHYPDEETRPMILPVEWRAALVLDDGITDYVTLPKMSTMRNALNSTAMDIMFYQSPLYRNEIMEGLIRSLNNVYNLFIENYPDFDGPISIFAHSLGSVMCYDLITSWSPLVLYDKYVAETIEEQLTTKTEHADILNDFRESRLKLLELYGGFQKAFITKKQKLNFKVTNMFCIGSPLAVFLIVRGVTKFVPGANGLKRIYNIFHPYDPVAYRLEPLVHKHYRLIRPIKLFPAVDVRSVRGYAFLLPEINRSYIKKLKAKEKQEKDVRIGDAVDKEHEEVVEDEDECESDDSLVVRPNSSGSSPRSLTPPLLESGEQKKSWWKFASGKKEKENTEGSGEEVKMNGAEKLIEEIPPEERLPYRIDYQVQPQITDRSYWSVLKSHFTYWTNPDVAAFIVYCLYRNDDKP